MLDTEDSNTLYLSINVWLVYVHGYVSLAVSICFGEMDGCEMRISV